MPTGGGSGGGSGGANGSGSSGGPSGDGGSATDSSGTTGALPSGECGCATPAPEDDFTPCDFPTLAGGVPNCASDSPCNVVSVSCPRPGADLYDCQPEFVFAEESLQCALAVLRDRQPARLSIEGTEGGVFVGQPLFIVRVRDSGAYVRSRCQKTDVGTSLSHRSGQLAEPAHFQGCLELAQPADQYDCLFQGLGQPSDLDECM